MVIFKRVWRLLRVGALYLAFGSSIAISTHLIVPAARLLGAGDGAEDLLTQRTLHRAARFVKWLAGALGVVDLHYDGSAELSRPGPLLVVANHPSNLDATFLIASMPQVDNVAEASWAEAPIIGTAVAKAGHLRNDHPREVIEEGVSRLESGRRLMIFPEGSRSPAGELRPFHRGAARIALASGCDLQTVVIRCDPPFGLKGQAWYDIPEETPRMSITVGARISAKDWVDGDESPGVAARKVTAGLREYFLRELGYAD